MWAGLLCVSLTFSDHHLLISEPPPNRLIFDEHEPTLIRAPVAGLLLITVKRSTYISSACAGLAGSQRPFTAVACRPDFPPPTAVLFPDWLSSRVVFSSFPVDSRRTTAAPPSDGPGGASSEGGGEGSASSVGWEEEEGSVRMFLEITGETEKHFNFVSKVGNLPREVYFPMSR